MQKILHSLSLRRRPVVFLPVFIDPHRKKRNRLVSRIVIFYSFEKEVIPVKNHIRVAVFSGVRTKINVANVPPETSVAADFHQQVLLGTRRFVPAVKTATRM